MTRGPIMSSMLRRQHFRNDPAVLPTFIATAVPQTALRIRGCTFSLKPLSGSGPV